MPDRLFIYGTLHPERAPREIAAAARRLTSIGRGTIRGQLLDLGEYPGVVLTGNAADNNDGNAASDDAPKVSGEVFLVPDAATLAALDTYEDYRPGSPAGSLFLREKTVVTFDDGSSQTCWVYIYNRSESQS